MKNPFAGSSSKPKTENNHAEYPKLLGKSGNYQCPSVQNSPKIYPKKNHQYKSKKRCYNGSNERPENQDCSRHILCPSFILKKKILSVLAHLY